MEEASKKRHNPTEGDASLEEAGTIELPSEEGEKIEEAPQEPASSAAEPIEPPPPLQTHEDDLKAEEVAPPPPDAKAETGKTQNNDHALRVACVMRSYLNMRPGGEEAATSSGDCDGAGDAAMEDRCRAMIEVVRKDNGRWSVSKVVLEHTHSLNPPPDPAGTLTSGGLVPVVGMEFESISTVKAYYGAYCEKMGFEMKTGSGKRSRGNRRLILQRFLCYKGQSPACNCDNNAAKKRKRMSAKTTIEKAAKVAKSNEETELIEVESSTEKAGIVCDDQRGEVQSAQTEKEAILEIDQNSTGGGKRGKVPVASNQGQSQLLRELGVRVSRYTNEERRNIILKYMQKRSNRQVVDRSIKVPSRQALAERRQRGVGGKFLSKQEMQCRELNQGHDRQITDLKDRAQSDDAKIPSSPKSPKAIPILNRLEETEEEPPELPEEVLTNANGVPIVGMIFESEAKAYDYYIKYAGSIGFSVRKGALERSVKHGTRSRVYVCSKEGITNNEVKKKRPETRTGCLARMGIRVTPRGRYRITEFVPDHNHQLIAPLNIQMLSSQKILTKIHHGGCKNASAIPSGYKNYLRAKRPKDMQVGDAGALLEYFQKMKCDNPSFYYAIQVDEYDQMTNIFWADVKSMTDYHYFGDVICFDTTYKANDYGRPFALFLGVNHHKQVIIYAAAFLYDESVESFKWLLESFDTAMLGRQPKTIFTDQCEALGDAITSVWPDTIQRLCAYQIYHNAVKQLDFVFQGSETFLHDFNHCLYDLEDEEEFLVAWKLMVEKYNLQDNQWLGKLYEEKDKWAAYGRHIFSADMQSSLRSESLSSLLKEHLNLEKDLTHFLKLYEVLVEERRYAELQADYHASQVVPRIPPLRLLWQAAHVYTPTVFEIFRREFDLLLECMVYSCGEVGTLSEYHVTVKEKIRAYYVRFDSSDCSAICSCRMFESTGIQCCHVLKVLDVRNFKELPPQYVLRRWRKDAKAGNFRENNDVALDSNLGSALSKRYSSLCRIMFNIASRASENVDTFMLLVNHSDQLLEQVERILQTRLVDKPSNTNLLKDQSDNLIENGTLLNENGSDSQKHNGKKKINGSVRRKHQNDTEITKRQKTRKGQVDEAEVAPREIEGNLNPNTIPSQPRNPSNPFLGANQFIQGPYVNPQFGVGTAQGFHHVSQFGQDSSAPTLQHQAFPGTSHLAQGFQTADMHALQFIGSNPQMDHQNTDQAQCSIPVWDFL